MSEYFEPHVISNMLVHDRKNWVAETRYMICKDHEWTLRTSRGYSGDLVTRAQVSVHLPGGLKRHVVSTRASDGTLSTRGDYSEQLQAAQGLRMTKAVVEKQHQDWLAKKTLLINNALEHSRARVAYQRDVKNLYSLAQTEAVHA